MLVDHGPYSISWTAPGGPEARVACDDLNMDIVVRKTLTVHQSRRQRLVGPEAQILLQPRRGDTFR
jgi:hypothetical protein